MRKLVLLVFATLTISACAINSGKPSGQGQTPPVTGDNDGQQGSKDQNQNDEDLELIKQKLSKVDYTLDVGKDEIKVMAYNVENFFDSEHDLNHKDWTYLPKSHPEKATNCALMSEGYYKKECFETDWTEEKVNLKTEQIARVIEHQGPAPDVLAIEEIENLVVANKLAKRLQYTGALITSGSDRRGINNVILYKEEKLTLWNFDSIVVGGNLNKHTRDILVARFKLKGSTAMLGVYVSHWPSQGNPATDRIIAANTLKDQIEADTKKFNDFHAVAVGDFNTIATDEPHPFFVIQNEKWQNRLTSLNNVWENLSEFGFNPKQLDAKTKAVRAAMPPGTYLYKNDWQYLDYIFVSQNLMNKTGFEVQPETFRIVVAPFASTLVKMEMSDETGKTRKSYFWAPKGLEPGATKPGDVGSSDHYPVVVRFKTN